MYPNVDFWLISASHCTKWIKRYLACCKSLNFNWHFNHTNQFSNLIFHVFYSISATKLGLIRLKWFSRIHILICASFTWITRSVNIQSPRTVCRNTAGLCTLFTACTTQSDEHLLCYQRSSVRRHSGTNGTTHHLYRLHRDQEWCNPPTLPGWHSVGLLCGVQVRA